MNTVNFEIRVDGWRMQGRSHTHAAMIEVSGCVYNCTVYQDWRTEEWRVYFGDDQVGWGVTREAAIADAHEVLSM